MLADFPVPMRPRFSVGRVTKSILRSGKVPGFPDLGAMAPFRRVARDASTEFTGTLDAHPALKRRRGPEIQGKP